MVGPFLLGGAGAQLWLCMATSYALSDWLPSKPVAVNTGSATRDGLIDRRHLMTDGSEVDGAASLAFSKTNYRPGGNM